MTVIVTVKINDGVVMASDSATTFSNSEGRPGQIYLNANKVFNLAEGLPIGAMTTGAGQIGAASIATLSKDLRSRFTDKDNEFPAWKLDKNTYTMEQVAIRVREFLFDEKAKKESFESFLHYRICGYSANETLPEVWDVILNEGGCSPSQCVANKDSYTVMCSGEPEAFCRIVNGVGTGFEQFGIQQGFNLTEFGQSLRTALGEVFVVPAMPIQDAIDLARYLVEVTIGFTRFSFNRPKTVGGPIEIATITKHEGFRWIERKHFYSTKLNN
jgi:hypothetical protein